MKEIDLFKALKTLWNRKWWILAVSLGSALIAYLTTALFMTPIYRSSFTVFVNNRSESVTTQQITSTDTSAAQSLTQTYAALIRNQTFIQDAVHLSGVVDDDKKNPVTVSTRVYQGTQLIDVYVDMTSSENGKKVADAMAELAPEYIAGIIEGTSMKVVSRPVAIPGQQWPSKASNTMIGAVAGFLLISMILIISSLLDVRVRNITEVENQYGIPIMGSIPSFEAQEKNNRRHGTNGKR